MELHTPDPIHQEIELYTFVRANNFRYHKGGFKKMTLNKKIMKIRKNRTLVCLATPPDNHYSVLAVYNYVI